MSLTRQQQIATDAVRVGSQGCLDDPWAEDLWNQLPAALRSRLRRANRAMESRTNDARAAEIYRGRAAEAVAYLCSEEQRDA